MVSAAIQITIKEFKLLFRSKRRILWLFSTTLAILAIGLITGLIYIFVESEEPVLLIAGESEEFEPGNSGVALKNLCEHYTEENFTVISLEIAERRLEDKDFDILVVLPRNFTALLLDNRTAVNAICLVYYDAGDVKCLQMAGEVELAIQHLNSAIVADYYNIEKGLWVAPDLENVAEGVGEFGAAILSMIPMYAILMLAMPAVSLTLISVTIEREQKTLEPLLLSRISRRSIVWGKLLYGLCLIGIVLGLNIISGLLAIFLFALISGIEVGSFVSFLKDAGEFLEFDVISFLFIVFGLVVISMLMVAICVLFSFLAKDEREGQMLASSVIAGPAISVLTFLFLPFADFPLWLKLFIALTPLFGFLQSTYFIFLESGVGLTALVGLLSQIIWLLLIIWATARLIESEGILEVSISQIFSLKNIYSRIRR